MWSVTTEFPSDFKANLHVCVNLYYSGYDCRVWCQIEVGLSPALSLSNSVALDKFPNKDITHLTN